MRVSKDYPRSRSPSNIAGSTSGGRESIGKPTMGLYFGRVTLEKKTEEKIEVEVEKYFKKVMINNESWLTVKGNIKEYWKRSCTALRTNLRKLPGIEDSTH